MAKDVYGDNFDVTVETDSSVGSLTAGIHRARCKEAKVEPNKARDSHNLVLTMESMEKGQEGRTARTWLSLKESARWKLTEALMKAEGGPNGHRLDVIQVRQWLLDDLERRNPDALVAWLESNTEDPAPFFMVTAPAKKEA